MVEYHPPDNEEWEVIVAALGQRNWTVTSLSVAVYDKHYSKNESENESENETNWITSPSSLQSWLEAWRYGRNTLGGDLLTNIEDVLECPLTDLCPSLVDLQNS